MLDKFKLDGEIVIVTGGSGLLGTQFCKAIQEIGGCPVILDIESPQSAEINQLAKKIDYIECDITKESDIEYALKTIKMRYNAIIVGLINGACIDSKVTGTFNHPHPRALETYSRDAWDTEIAVGLTGAFLCTKIFGAEMAKNKRGSIINISSDLGLIGPDQRLYDENHPKPVTYSVIKHGIIGLTRYIATYWADKGIRCNALCPGGVYTGQPAEFVQKLNSLIPLKRMAYADEYSSIIQLLLTEASSYITGSIIVADGGRTAW